MAQGTTTNLKLLQAILTDTELGLNWQRTLQLLKSKSLGSMWGASPQNPKAVANGASAVFRVQKFTKWKNYTAANRNDAGDLIDNKIALTIHMDKALKTHYEVESLDLAAMDVQTRGEYIAIIGDGMAAGLAALLDARFLKTAVDNVIAETDDVKSLAKQLIIPDITNLNTANKRTDAYLMLVDKVVELTREINDRQIGTNINDFASFLKLSITNRLLLAMPKGGESATKIGTDLATVKGTALLGGILVKDHIILGQNIPANTAFDKDQAYDFDNIVGAIFHNEAIFCAISAMQATAVIDPNSGNQKYISKFLLGNGVVRDNLFALIVKARIPKHV